MKVYVVIEDGEFKCDIVGVYMNEIKALEKKMKNFTNRDIIECEVEEQFIMDYRIFEKYSHYEVFIDGKFYCSADTMTEAIHEIVNNYLN